MNSLYIFSKVPWTRDRPMARCLPINDNDTEKTGNPWAGFELKIPIFERLKKVGA
jgi:hypothetical protein